LGISGSLSVGTGYAAIAAPTNGAIVAGLTGIGTSTPAASSGGAVSVDKLNVFSTTTAGSTGTGGVMVEFSNASGGGVSLSVNNTVATNAYNVIEGIARNTGTTNSPAGVFGLNIPTGGSGFGGSFITNSSNAASNGLYCQMPTASAGYALYVNGDAFRSGGQFGPSDQNLKENITQVTGVTQKLKQLGVYTYNFKPELVQGYGMPAGQTYGVLAQELERVFPQLVKTTKLQATKEGLAGNSSISKTMDAKGVNYEGLVPILLEAIKEQQQQIDELKLKVEELNKK
jgi:hypothetical protein